VAIIDNTASIFSFEGLSDDIQRVLIARDRVWLSEQARDGQSLPIRLAAQKRLRETWNPLQDAEGSMHLDQWLEELYMVKQDIQSIVQFEVGPLEVQMQKQRDRFLSKEWQTQALSYIIQNHPDISFLDCLSANLKVGFSSLRRRDLRDDRLIKLNKLSGERREAIMPVWKDGGMRGGEFDGEQALQDYQSHVEGSISEHFANQFRIRQNHLEAQIDLEIDSVRQVQLSARRQSRPDSNAAWKKQELAEIESRAKQYERQAVAITLENSLFNDHIVYAEAKPKRVQTMLYSIHLEIASSRTIWRQLSKSWQKITKQGLRSKAYQHDFETFQLCMYEYIEWTSQSSWQQRSQKHLQKYLPHLAQTQWEEEWLGTLEPFISEYAQAKMAWVDSPHPEMGIFAQVGRGREDALIESLKRAGGSVEANLLEIPAYRSWAKVRPGVHLALQTSNQPASVHIEYSPHNNLQAVPVRVHHHQITFPVAQAWDKIIEKFDSQWTFSKREGLVQLRSLAGKTIIVGLGDYAESDQESIQMAIDSGLSVHLDEPPLDDYEYYAREATDEEVLTEWVQIDQGRWADKDSSKEYFKRLKKLQGFKDTVFKAEWTSKYSASPQTESSPTWWESRPENMSQAQWAPQAIVGREALIALKKHWEDKDYWLGDIFSKLALKTPFEHHAESDLEIRNVAQEAPFSERGILRMRGELQALLSAIEELEWGFLSEWVPSNWIPPVGRVKPLGLEYAGGERQVQLSPGLSIVHGLTGARGMGDALDRLVSMVRFGGIKSIAERRRMQLNIHTMSPLGDIASGLDQGVPCKIGLGPSYGKWIFFALKPEVLMRRDLWFADRDFGGGRCRYDLYNQYAKRIGQERLHTPAPAAARERHLREAWDCTHNEVWLKHEIAWDEIDALYVCSTEGFFDIVRARVDEWKSQGLLPEELAVIPYPAEEDNQELAWRMQSRALEMQNLSKQPKPLAPKTERFPQKLAHPSQTWKYKIQDEVSEEIIASVKEMEIDPEMINTVLQHCSKASQRESYLKKDSIFGDLSHGKSHKPKLSNLDAQPVPPPVASEGKPEKLADKVVKMDAKLEDEVINMAKKLDKSSDLSFLFDKSHDQFKKNPSKSGNIFDDQF
jgi:hypothetical protein